MSRSGRLLQGGARQAQGAPRDPVAAVCSAQPLVIEPSPLSCLDQADADHNRDRSRPTHDAEALAKNTATAFQGSSGKNSGPLG